jgi:hypothetical protein
MKKLLLPICLFCLIIHTSCSKYKVQFEGAYDDKTGVDIKSQTKDHQILYVQSGKLYTIDPKLEDIRPYPNLPTGIVFAAINPAHTKIAYKTALGNITLIDSSGTQLATIASTSAVTSFDWHANNETLYYVDGFTLKFYGKSVPVAITNFNTSTIFPIGSTEKTLFGAIVNADGSVIYVREYYTGWNYSRILTIDNVTGSDINQQMYDFSINVSWLRTSLKADVLAFGGRKGSLIGSYRAYLNASSTPEYLSSNYFTAYAPDGLFTVSINATGMWVSGAKQYSKFVNSAQITALDW